MPIDPELKNIWQSLWRDKPLLITVGVGAAVLVYILYKNNKATLVAPDATTGTSTGMGTSGTSAGAYYDESSYYYYSNYAPTITNPTTGVPIPLPPVPGPRPPVPTPKPKPPVPGPKQPPKPGGAKTFTVAQWNQPGSSLFSIAQIEYGNGNLWPVIYNANKQKIGPNPNLIYKGTVLTIPPKP